MGARASSSAGAGLGGVVHWGNEGSRDCSIKLTVMGEDGPFAQLKVSKVAIPEVTPLLPSQISQISVRPELVEGRGKPPAPYPLVGQRWRMSFD